jgi:arylsulfatase A-like enzyme
MINKWKKVAFACLGLAFMGVSSFGVWAEDRPNVLMLCVDDLNDWVSYLDGHPQAKTPHMEKLARRGVNFSNAHCTSPGCSPSRNALMFGVEPHNSGLYPFYDIVEIPESTMGKFTPLPLLLRNHGYTTVGLNKVFHNPDNAYKQKEQWDEYHSLPDGKLKLLMDEGYVPEEAKKAKYPAKSKAKRLIACPASNPKEDFRDHKISVKAAKFLKKKHDKPFFLAVGYILPHTPLIAPKENFDRFAGPIQEPLIKADDLDDIPMVGRANAQIYVEHPMREQGAWEQMRRAYLACTSFTDDNIGVVLDALEKSDYAENTIIVLWSDHGYHLGEKRSFSKFSLWNEATRTPFLIYDPREKSGHGQVCDEPVGLINVYKTVCDLVGISTPEYVDGISLKPWLKDPKKEKTSPAMTTWGRGNYTLRTKNWRYTRYFDGTEELYEQGKDPNEWSNLAGHPEYAPLMKSFRDQWLPKHETPQIKEGIKLYNVADADNPTKVINSFKRHVKAYNKAKLMPPISENFK